MEQKQINIKDKLPTHKAPASMWDRIEQQLDALNKEVLNISIASKLPNYTAPSLFDRIVPPAKTKNISLIWLQLAASIILLVGLGFGFKQFKNRTKTQITYTVENNTNKTIKSEIELSNIDADFNEVLSYNCQTKPKVCQMPDYKELQKQLEDIEREEQNLKQYKSPEIEMHLIRITNDKLKIENYILNLFS
jgi:tetrahydromethanopterin S-methyltransferase subunit G